MKKTLAAASFGAVIAMSGMANAATLNFTYAFDEFVSMAGQLTGAISSGVVTVGAVSGRITSSGGALGATSYAFDTNLGGFHVSGDEDIVPAMFALDGSFFDIAVIAQPISQWCVDGAGFCLLRSFASVNLNGLYADYIFEAGNGSFELVDDNIAPIPLPAAGYLLIAGLGGIAA